MIEERAYAYGLRCTSCQSLIWPFQTEEEVSEFMTRKQWDIRDGKMVCPNCLELKATTPDSF